MTSHPTARDGVPETYPGRLAYFPPTLQRLVVGVLGLQQRELENLAQARRVDEEMRVWREQTEAPIAGWVVFLADAPSATVCQSIRDCYEREPATWSTLIKRSRVALLLSLGHIREGRASQRARTRGGIF